MSAQGIPATRKPSIVLGVTADVSHRLLAGLPAYLVSCGWDVHVVSAPGPELARLAQLTGVRTHAIAMKRRPAPFGDLRALAEWRRLLRTVRPDVASIGTPKAALLGLFAARSERVPRRVYLVRGLRLETTRGPARSVLRALERFTAGCSTDLVAVSESLRDEALRLGIGSPDSTVVLGHGSSNGVDLGRFAGLEPTDEDELRRALGLTGGTPVIGFVGRVTRDKGARSLAIASSRLHARGIAHRLLIVGDDEGGAAALGAVPSAIEIVRTGHTREPEKFFGLMDVLCLPTRREGFPNVVLEASAAGIPTVTTRATGAVDSVVDGETGLLVDVGDDEALAAAIARLLTDDSRRIEMGRAARDRVANHFDRGEVQERYERWYRSKLPPLHPTYLRYATKATTP